MPESIREQEARVSSQPLCVLGMARSGTSLTSMILSRLGVDFGPSGSLHPATADNERGYWEHRLLREASETILAHFGGCWDAPPALPPGWEELREFDALREKVRQRIRADFGDSETWGWKDPLTCFTLPFWQQILPRLRTVLCVRPPLDVARSLERRNGFSLEKGYDLWLRYLAGALQHTREGERVVIRTTEWMDDWQGTLRKLAQFLGKPERAEESEVQADVQQLIDAQLWHHRTSFGALAAAQRVYDSLVGDSDAIDRELRDALAWVGPEAESTERRRLRAQEAAWRKRVRLAAETLRERIPPGERLLLVDEGELGEAVAAGLEWLPFPERDGRFWGSPADDASALEELRRLRAAGARFMVFAWPAFWWFDHYRKLHRYLRDRFPCVLQDEQLVAFDMNSRS